MTDDTGDLNKIDEALMTYDLSDEALEAAARLDGGRAVTIGYCTTVWYCMPFWAAQRRGKHTATDVVAKAQAVLSEPELLRTMFDVGYFPPNMPPLEWTARRIAANIT
jgi:hypothetical protein